jgi:phosphatidylserine/phosphatidylglycerophosphate/cardiolipin synthase-like enzyme
MKGMAGKAMWRASILGLCVGLAGLASSEAQGRSVENYFSPQGGGHEAVARLISQAKQYIQIAMYSISPGQVAMWNPLADAVKRGVKCYVILEKANSTAMKPKATALENIGCDVRFVSGTMHQKFAVVDGKHVTTGSANWSTGAEQKYSENITIYRDYLGVAKDYSDEFVRLWNRSVDFPVVGSVRYPAAQPGPGTMPQPADGIYNLFTSQNSATSYLLNDALIGLIKGAKSTLDIAVAHFETAAIKDAVCQAVARGVKLRVLTDMGEYAIGVSKVKALESCKTEVRYKVYGLTWWHPFSQLMHHKFLIADRTWLATGSYNWSNTAEKSNYENLQVINAGLPENAKVLAAFQKEFDELWDQNRAKVGLLTKAFTTPTAKCQPIHWDTSYLKLVIALTRKEYQKIRALGLQKGGLYDRKKAMMRCVDVNTGQVFPTVPTGTTFWPGL